LINKDFI